MTPPQTFVVSCFRVAGRIWVKALSFSEKKKLKWLMPRAMSGRTSSKNSVTWQRHKSASRGDILHHLGTTSVCDSGIRIIICGWILPHRFNTIRVASPYPRGRWQVMNSAMSTIRRLYVSICQQCQMFKSATCLNFCRIQNCPLQSHPGFCLIDILVRKGLKAWPSAKVLSWWAVGIGGANGEPVSTMGHVTVFESQRSVKHR